MALSHQTLVSRACLALAALALLRIPSASASPRELASLTFEVIQCPQGRSEVPRLFVAVGSEYPKLNYVATDAPVQKADDGYFVLTTKIAQGNYFYRLESEHCFNYTQDAVLGGHGRTLSIALYRRMPRSLGKFFGIENAVAGTLPVRPDVGWIVAADGSKRVLDLQDGAFYIERVYPGKYSLRFELHGGWQSEIDVDLSSVSSTQLVERDLDLSTVRQNLGNILATGGTLKECDYCY
jgi:hypothetical protein